MSTKQVIDPQIKRDLLKRYYGYDQFRRGQEALIDAVLLGYDALGIMPTGGGKSLCYQLPSLLLSGVTLVISPLISLMQDQVESLKEIGIPATYLNSTLSLDELRIRIDAIMQGKYRLIYVAPERLNSYLFPMAMNRANVALIAVDEAHCISKWGHDFRPAYQEIPRFLNALDKRPPIAAYTATATPQVIDEIIELLTLNDPIEVNTGFDRPNLTYQVIKSAKKIDYITQFITTYYPKESGIIYCSTRRSVDSLTERLIKLGFNAAAYHAGLTNQERSEHQRGFIRDEITIIVATNAFGMGIDKPNVRFVIHYNMPQNMEAYYQEAGRAGRDGDPAHAILLYTPRDISQQKYFIEHPEHEISEERREQLYQNLQFLVDYCHTQKCLRGAILKYFAEEEIPTQCDNCGNCTDPTPQVDMTVEAQKILSCIYRLKQNYGIRMVSDVLRGSKRKEILAQGFHQLSTYNLMSEYSLRELQELIMALIAEGYIRQTTEKYPRLQLTQRARPLLKGAITFYHRAPKVEKRITPTNSDIEPYDTILFEILRDLRKEIAQERSVPAYVIFHDSSLREMCRKLPTTRALMLTIKGVGVKKFEAYGALFCNEIADYLKQKELSTTRNASD